MCKIIGDKSFETIFIATYIPQKKAAQLLSFLFKTHLWAKEGGQNMSRAKDQTNLFLPLHPPPLRSLWLSAALHSQPLRKPLFLARSTQKSWGWKTYWCNLSLWSFQSLDTLTKFSPPPPLSPPPTPWIGNKKKSGGLCTHYTFFFKPCSPVIFYNIIYKRHYLLYSLPEIHLTYYLYICI